MRRLLRRLPALLWLVLVAGSLALGGRELRVRIATRARVPFTPRASSDSFLAILAIEQPAESVRRVLSTVPADDSAVFVARTEDPWYFQTLYTFSLLAWPHQVAGVGCPAAGGAGAVRVPMDVDQRISAFVYFHMPPPAPAAEQLAPDVSLVRTGALPTTSKWTSFCSSPPPPSS